MGSRHDGRRRLAAALLAVIVLAGLTSACTGDSGAILPPAQPTATPSPTPPPVPFTFAIGPDAGAAGLPISTEVAVRLTGGSVTEVSLTKAGAAEKVAGSMRADGTSWVPDAPLAFNTPYEASVTAKSTDGAKTETLKTSFTTMGRFGRETGTGLYLFDGQTVGVGMPVVVEFVQSVPEQYRAGVQSRLFVTTDPPQPGVWHWASGKQVWYRAPDYWRPGTTISVRAALRGVPSGDGRYGDTDRSATVTVGRRILMDVDNATKHMKVFQDGVLVKDVPVSLGKPSTPSSSGHMVVMSKHYEHTFDTRGEPNGGYVVDVNYAMRVTWGGEFIHAAPWSVNDQGVRNVSHGCVNMATPNAEWLFNQANIGDPIIVRGTEVQLENGNGWTAWNITWAQYVQGSALPVPPEIAALPGVDPLTGASPKTTTDAVVGAGATPSPTR
jgi:lipoprotein-anchoring transpeptidase ErfK/SrfK